MERPLVGVGVLITQAGSDLVLVGKRYVPPTAADGLHRPRTAPHPTRLVPTPPARRKGAHGGGEFALPGGHLEHGESFEECGVREVLEETGLELSPAGTRYAYAVNTVFPAPSEAHYVTVFCTASVPAGAQPRNCEPHKCEGWQWVRWGDLRRKCQPLFLPLALLLDSGYELKETAAAAAIAPELPP